MKKLNFTDAEIIEGIKNQDNKVILYIYQLNFRSVKKFIEDNSGTEKDAEDIFQDTLILLYNKIRVGGFALTSSFNTYLFSIAKFNWYNTLRRRKVRNTVSDECDTFTDNEQEFYTDLHNAERKKLIVKHFNEISSDCQKIISLVLNGYSIAEITELMGYNSEQHTKNRRLRCKKALILKILNDPNYKELSNERTGKITEVPRW